MNDDHIVEQLRSLSIPISSINEDVENVRVHDDRNIEAIRNSLKRFGQRLPIVIQKQGMVVRAGNARLRAAKELGWRTIAAVIIDESNVNAIAFSIADNRTSELASWDNEGLIQIIQTLQNEDEFDLGDIGYSAGELQELIEDLDSLNSVEEIEEDEVPDVPDDPVTQPGDLWILGRHRLLCGDATDEDAVGRLMDVECGRLMNTDPPYGVAYVGGAQSKNQAVGYKDIENDELDGEKLQGFLESVIRAATPFLAKNTAFYLWHPMLTQGAFFAAAAAADILIHRQIIWVKPSFVFGRGEYHWRHELCFYGWIRGNRPPFYGERNQDTVWEVGRDKDKVHPTQKPVSLFAVPIQNHLKKDEVCYEPFAGSGPQFIAAEQLGRRCYGMEIEPKYCDVIIQRWENLTGKKAIRK